jgi:hypothetical protein
MSSEIQEFPGVNSCAFELEPRPEPKRPTTDPGGAVKGAGLRPSDGHGTEESETAR